MPKPTAAPQPTFSTRNDAEVYLAEHDLAGVKKPQRAGSRWYLVDNKEGLVNRSLFTEMLRVSVKRQAKEEGWRLSELAAALVDVPHRAAKLWRKMGRSKRRAK